MFARVRAQVERLRNLTDFWIGVGVLAGSLVLFFIRRVVQDGESVHWSEITPKVPDQDELEMLGPAAPAGAMVAH